MDDGTMMRASDIMNAIGQAVSEASAALEAREMDRFWSYFTEAELQSNENSEASCNVPDPYSLKPRVRVLRIDYGGDSDVHLGEGTSAPVSEHTAKRKIRKLCVPVAALIPQRQMALAEVRISMSVKTSIKNGELYFTPTQQSVTVSDWTTPDAILYGNQTTKSADRVELIFRAGEPSEGTLRVQHELNKTF